jgi:dolichyl-phosphate-mannose-protein mannosyltransferase
MPLGEYLTGALFLLGTIGAALAAAGLVVGRRFRYLPVLPRSLAFMVLATAALVFAGVVPAALGILSRLSVMVAAGAALLAAWLVPASPPPATTDPQPQPGPSGRFSILIAVTAVGAVAVYELARVRVLVSQPITFIDMLGFHLPGVAHWIQAGTLWNVDQFLPGFATAQYPNNGDLLLLEAILPWRDLAFVRLVPVPFYLFTGVGAFALALELGASRAAAATLAAALITVPAMASLALEGLPDVIALATLAAGLVFLVRHGRSGRLSELMLAGLALGLSAGTKWYGLTAVVAVLAVWVPASFVRRRSLGRVARDGGALLGMIFAGGGLWLVRNLVESANPIYPKAVSLLGVQLFAGSHNDVIDRYGYTIADYLGSPHILSTYIYPGFKIEVGVTGAVLLAGFLVAVLAGALELRRAHGRRPIAAFGLGLAVAALGMIAVYAITPGSAYGPKGLPVEGFVNIRWLMPAIVIGAALTARAVAALGPAGVALEVAGLAGAIDGIHLGAGVPGSTVAKVVLALTALTASVLLAQRWVGANRWPGSRTPRVLALIAACAAVVALGRLDQVNFDHRGYAGFDPTFAWIDAHAPTGRRVGITGIWSTAGISPVLPAFGPRLGNHVSYVGDRVRHSLHLPASESSFDDELRRGRYDLLLIGLQDAAHTDVWARHAGYRLVAGSARLALYAAPA